MFKTEQIVTSTKLIRGFKSIAKRLLNNYEAILITQKGNKFMVLVNARMFEDLVEFQHEARAAGYMGKAEWGEL